MLQNFAPFNIDLLLLQGNASVSNLRQIKVMDITAGMSKNFHPDGLYSSEIFFKTGDARRSAVFGYIDLNIQIFHPVYYKAICELKELYGTIMSGRSYATFDHQLGDFIKADPVIGETGFKFFLDHFNKIKFTERDSPKRTFNIKLVEKYRKAPMMDKLLVLPAGLRDYTIDENGKPSEDDINNLYRRVIGTANVIGNVAVATNEESLNNTRYNLQMSVNQIYEYITNIMDGKGKLIQGKWAARAVDNSTRNVITPYIQRIVKRDDPQFVSSSQYVVGIYQFTRSIFPLAVHLVKETYLSSVFPGPNATCILFDPKTLKPISVQIDPSFYDDWMTTDGLEKQFNRFKVKDLRHEPVLIGNLYLGLMYNGPDVEGRGNCYRFISGNDDIPEWIKPEHLHPITYSELYYLSLYKQAPKIIGVITRYPITGYGSIYPSYTYLKSTINGLVKYELDNEWKQTGVFAGEYPKAGDYFFDALSPASQHLGRLGGDWFLLQSSLSEMVKNIFLNC